MSEIDLSRLDLFLLEECVWLAVIPVGLAVYDFAFEPLFVCRRPWQRPNVVTAIGRFGAVDNYQDIYAALQAQGIALVHTPEQQRRSSDLAGWYPRLAPLTARSMLFETPPAVELIEQHFAWPVFVKASRRTSRHQAALSIVRSRADYERVAAHYRADPLLRAQGFVCREYLQLRPIPAPPDERIPPAFEFRTFWWRGRCVGAGPYWTAADGYAWTQEERRAALALACEAARLVDVPFLVVDVAQCADGRWVVIECNDGQESGYGGVNALTLWQQIVAIERSAQTG